MDRDLAASDLAGRHCSLSLSILISSGVLSFVQYFMLDSELHYNSCFHTSMSSNYCMTTIACMLTERMSSELLFGSMSHLG